MCLFPLAGGSTLPAARAAGFFWAPLATGFVEKQLKPVKDTTTGNGYQNTRLSPVRPRAVPRLVMSAMAAAVSLGISNPSQADIRLILNEEISSKTESVAGSSFDGRLPVDALIQSHPNPLFVELEDRYQALPPFMEASEAIPEQYIAEATTSERLIAGAGTLVNNLSEFMPRLRTSARHDDIKEESINPDDGGPQKRDFTTMLAIVNPTFEYRTERRKWYLRARYDYERGRYFVDREDTFNDHTVNVNWTTRLERGKEVEVQGLYEDTHDRVTRDPIVDFDSSLESQDLNYNRAMVKALYRQGTLRDRSRYNVYLYSERSQLEGNDLFLSGYELDRTGLGGRYDWQLRRQMSLVAEVRYNRFDYDLSLRDNDHVRALVGTDMILGRRMRADLRVGYEEKEFDQALGQSSMNEPVWEGTFEWALRRKTHVKVETGRNIFELAPTDSPIDAGKFNIQEWVSASWREKWSDRLSTDTSYTIRETELVGRNNEQDAEQFIVSASYQLSNRLKFAVDGAYTIEQDKRGNDLSRRTLTLRTDYSL